MKTVLKYLGKYLLKPINRILGNHLIQSLLSYFSFQLLRTEQANQYLANLMLLFAITAFTLWILEKFLGVKTPLFNISKFFKAFRHQAKLENPDSLDKTFEMGYEESKKIYKLGKRGFKYMKKLLGLFVKYLLANKITYTGIFVVFYFYYDIVEELFNTNQVYNLNDFMAQGNQFYVVFGLYTLGLLIGMLATTKQGLEDIDIWLSRVKFKKLNKHILKLEELSGVDILPIEKIKFILNKARKILLFLEKIKLLNKEDEVRFSNVLNRFNTIIDDYELEKIAEKRRREDEALARYNQPKSTQPQQPTQPNSIRNRNIR